jgi:hypothetical protein
MTMPSRPVLRKKAPNAKKRHRILLSLDDAELVRARELAGEDSLQDLFRSLLADDAASNSRSRARYVVFDPATNAARWAVAGDMGRLAGAMIQASRAVRETDFDPALHASMEASLREIDHLRGDLRRLIRGEPAP